MPMRPWTILMLMVMLIATAIEATNVASAASLYWSGSGSAQGGSGTWGTTLTTFGTAAAGPFDLVWDNALNFGDTVLFGGPAGVVTLDTEISVRGLTLNNNTTITGTSPLNGGGAALVVSIGGGSNRAIGATLTAPIIGTGGLSVSGSRGPLVLGVANTFSGTAAIGGGSAAGTTVVQIDDPAALPTTANLNLKNGIVMLTATSGNFSRSIGTGNNQVQLNGGGGFAASGGDRTVTLGGSTISWNGTNSFAKTSPFMLGHASADSTITLTNALNLSNGTRTVLVGDGSAAIDAVLAGQVGVSSGSSGSLTKTGDGTLALPANNLLNGTVAVSGGTLQLGNAGTTGALANAAGITVSSGATFAVNRTNAISQGTGFPAITGAGGFAQAGSGTTTLTAANAFSGPTRVKAGVLRLAAGGSIDASSRVTVSAGAVFDATAVGTYIVPATQTLAGSGTMLGTIVTGSGATISPGASPGTLTFDGSLTFGGGGNYSWQILSGTGTAGSTGTWDLVNVTGGLSIDATSADPFHVNLWTLSSITPDVSGSAANFDPYQNYTWTIASAAGGITGFAADKFAIATSATNGTGGFANAIGTGSFGMALDGNNLNLVYTAGAAPSGITINVASGTQTQTQAGYPTLSGTQPLEKTGAGTLVLDQANTISGSTSVQGGVLQLANLQALQLSTVVPVAGGTMALSPYQVVTIGGLHPNAGGLTDVGNGLVTVSAGLSAADLVTAILAGQGDGSWNGTSGITSSAAAADTALGTSRAVGWLDNGDGTVTFAYAAPGDTNLDWSIDLLDISTYLAAGKYDSGEPAAWSEGDYTYDGLVDITDVALYLGTGLFDVGPYNPPAGANGVAAVPEPVGLGVIALFIAAAAVRRRSNDPR